MQVLAVEQVGARRYADVPVHSKRIQHLDQVRPHRAGERNTGLLHPMSVDRRHATPNRIDSGTQVTSTGADLQRRDWLPQNRASQMM